MNTLQSTHLMAWWHHICVKSHLTKLQFEMIASCRVFDRSGSLQLSQKVVQCSSINSGWEILLISLQAVNLLNSYRFLIKILSSEPGIF